MCNFQHWLEWTPNCADEASFWNVFRNKVTACGKSSSGKDSAAFEDNNEPEMPLSFDDNLPFYGQMAFADITTVKQNQEENTGNTLNLVTLVLLLGSVQRQ
ncbi:hypothetical protein T4D_6250 [Trichinella pseudospiralis]|uniref:Uncharacterized protein n=1 Tax=Trichinella pseudospiralis TaxID=6337 RepID=A0A0V1FPL5_TRIPS|nr:hypothetical protein T4D_6250 [Trichinella pseudospiralis]